MSIREPRRLTDYKGDLYHRHYCKDAGHRVFPYDSMEALTLSPEIGVSGRPVLLYSANGHRRDHDDITRTAWCWACNKWVDTFRETKTDTLVRYLKRNGVSFRFNGQNRADIPERTFVKVLDARLEEKRMGGGTITFKRKKRK